MSCHLLADALERSKNYQADPACSAKDIYKALEKNVYQVLLISTNFPEQPVGGLALIRDIQARNPQLNIVVLVDSPERATVVEAFRAGARGIFCRSDSFQTLCKCIGCVHEGQVWANSSELQYVLDALAEGTTTEPRVPAGTRPLSKREEEIARLVAEGLSNRQISERLSLSEHTIKNYLFRVFEKLGVGTRVELALYALNRGSSRKQLQPVRRSTDS
jgi:DNA-binding NarL/FixJ family response regulator